MIADLLREENKPSTPLSPQVADHPWRLSLSCFWSIVFLSIGLIAPKLPDLFPHLRIGWMVASFLLATAAASMTSSKRSLRLISAAIGAVLTFGVFSSLVQYNLIDDEMTYRLMDASWFTPRGYLVAVLFSPMVAWHCARIEQRLSDIPVSKRERTAVWLGLLQSIGIALVIVALLFVAPMLAAQDDSANAGKFLATGENPWFVLAIGGSTLVAGTISGLFVSLLPCRSQ